MGTLIAIAAGALAGLVVGRYAKPQERRAFRVAALGAAVGTVTFFVFLMIVIEN